MKLYRFHPSDFGLFYFVMEKDRKSAFEALIKLLENELEKRKEHYKKSFSKKEYDTKIEYWCEDEIKTLEKWKKATASNQKTYPDGYKVDEIEAGKVVCIEFS